MPMALPLLNQRGSRNPEGYTYVATPRSGARVVLAHIGSPVVGQHGACFA